MDENNIVNYSIPYAPPTISIDTNRLGVWRYSPRFDWSQYHVEGIITLTGRRTHDYCDVEEDTREDHMSRFTVWHHVHNFNSTNDKCTLQLVDWDTHAGTIPHAGGCKQYSEYYATRYRASQECKINFFKNMYVPSICSEEEIKNFADNFNINFS